jgi:RHS repeat-associated protein
VLARTNSYGPYGDLTATSGTGPDDIGYDQSYNSQPAGLDHFGARLTDPTTGRWTQPDPDALSLQQDPTQADAYNYAGDDPVNGVDPSGDYLFNPGLRRVALGCVAATAFIAKEPVRLALSGARICHSDEDRYSPGEQDPHDEPPPRGPRLSCALRVAAAMPVLSAQSITAPKTYSMTV